MSQLAVSIPIDLPPFVVVASEATLAQVNALTARADATVVDSLAAYQEADALYAQLYTIEKAIEKNRKEIKDPITAAGKAIDAAARPLLEALSTKRERLGAAVAAFKAAEDAKRSAEAKEMFGDATDTKGLALKSNVRTRTEPRVVIDEPAKIPRQYLVPDEAAIKKALLAGLEVAGCRLVEEQKTAANGARL